MTKSTDPQLAYGLKITLVETKPPIWRRVWVPGEITLDRLHDIIQITMGWQDSHLQFLKACKDPKHPEHKQNLRWVGGAFDLTDFNPEAVNAELRKYARWSRPRDSNIDLEEEE